MESENPDAGRARGSPIEDNGFKDLVLSPADEREIHCRHSGNGDASSAGGRRDEGSGSVGDGDHGGDGRVVNVLDILVKGSPPPTTGDSSPGRNHVNADSGGMGFGDGGEEEGGLIRVVLVESLAKGSKPRSPGESSKRRNSVSRGATVSVSLQCPSDGVDGNGVDDSEERTTSTSGSSPNNEGQ